MGAAGGVVVLALAAAACGGSSSAPVAEEATVVDEPPPPAALTIRELYARDGDAIVLAPAADQAVAQGYASAPHGAVHAGHRMSILTARTRYAVGEPVRVIHVVEVEAGHDSYVMGPKAIYGEYVDGALRTPEPAVPDYPWVGEYDGAVLPGPDADVNFEVTTYRFDTPGAHTLEWRLGAMRSNRIALDVGEP